MGAVGAKHVAVYILQATVLPQYLFVNISIFFFY